MKDTRPIETQVKELTADQKKSIRRVGVTYDVVMSVVVLLYIVVALFFMVQLGTTNHEIENISFYKTVTENGKTVDMYDATVYEHYMTLVARQEQTMTAFVIVAAVGLMLVLAVMGVGLLVVHSKCPEYSDKRFVYIGKMNRAAKKK